MKLTNSISLRNLTFSKHDESEFDRHQLKVLNNAIDKGIDMSKYANPIYNAQQLNLLLDGLENGFNVTYYHKPIFSEHKMLIILEALHKFHNTKYEENIALIANPRYTEREMQRLATFIKRPYAKKLAKRNLSYYDLEQQIYMIDKMQFCYNTSQSMFDYALNTIDRWRDKDEISE